MKNYTFEILLDCQQAKAFYLTVTSDSSSNAQLNIEKYLVNKHMNLNNIIITLDKTRGLNDPIPTTTSYSIFHQ